MAFRPTALAVIHVQTDEHPPTLIVRDHLVEIGFLRPAKRQGCDAFDGSNG